MSNGCTKGDWNISSNVNRMLAHVGCWMLDVAMRSDKRLVYMSGNNEVAGRRTDNKDKDKDK